MGRAGPWPSEQTTGPGWRLPGCEVFPNCLTVSPRGHRGKSKWVTKNLIMSTFASGVVLQCYQFWPLQTAAQGREGCSSPFQLQISVCWLEDSGSGNEPYIQYPPFTKEESDAARWSSVCAWGHTDRKRQSQNENPGSQVTRLVVELLVVCTSSIHTDPGL